MFFAFTPASEWTEKDKEVVGNVIVALVIYGLALTVMPWALAAAITIAFFYSKATGGIVAKVLEFCKTQWLNFKAAFTEAYTAEQQAQG